MSSELVSVTAYSWFLSSVIGGAAAYWVGIDSYRLKKALAGDRTDPAIRDRIFGSVIGIIVGFVGLLGVFLRHN